MTEEQIIPVVDEQISDFALAEHEAETKSLAELLSLVDGALAEVSGTNICSSSVMADHLLDMRRVVATILSGRVV